MEWKRYLPPDLLLALDCRTGSVQLEAGDPDAPTRLEVGAEARSFLDQLRMEGADLVTLQTNGLAVTLRFGDDQVQRACQALGRSMGGSTHHPEEDVVRWSLIPAPPPN